MQEHGSWRMKLEYYGLLLQIVEFSEPGWEEVDEFDKAEKNTAEEIIIERERERRIST